MQFFITFGTVGSFLGLKVLRLIIEKSVQVHTLPYLKAFFLSWKRNDAECKYVSSSDSRNPARIILYYIIEQ